MRRRDLITFLVAAFVPWASILLLEPAQAAPTGKPALDPQDAHRFLMDGQPWYPAGYYPGLGTFTIRDSVTPTLANYMTQFFDTAASHGINYCRLLSGYTQGYSVPVQQSLPYVVVGTTTGDGFTFPVVDLDQFNQAHFDYVHSMIDYARTKGIVVQLCLLDSWHINNLELPWSRKYDFLSPGMNVNGVAVNSATEWHSITTSSIAWQRLTALVRKQIDSWGDLPNIVWETSNEPNFYYDGLSYPDRPAPINNWTVQMGNYIQSYETSSRGSTHVCIPVNLPDHQHTAGQRANFFATVPDETDGYTGAGTHRDLLYQITNDIPVVLPQPLIADSDAWGTDLTPDEARKKVWGCLTAVSHMDYFHYNLGDLTTLASQDVSDRMRYIGYVNKFMTDLAVTLEGMVPSDNLISSGWCCARAGNELVIYLTSGGATNVTGLPSSYTARWFNPRTGTNQPAFGGPNFSAPDTNDWVLYIRSAALRPFHGLPAAVPGTIEAEDYDVGGEGVTYHDTTPGNNGAVYREEDVDIQATIDVGGGFNITSTADDEWLEYTVNVSTYGRYTVNLRVAAAVSGGSASLQLDGAALGSSISIPSTGGSQIWSTVSLTGLILTPGVHILHLAIDSGGFNINWIQTVLTGHLVPSDFDLDGDVDQQDFAVMQRCFSGGSPYNAGCESEDLNDDGKVNATDLGIFLNCMGGADINPPC